MQNLYLRLAPFLVAIIEFILMIATGFLILRAQRHKRRTTPALQSLERSFNKFARRQKLAALAVGFGVILTRVALIPILGIPEPQWHDEFSYLLAADTFAHLRLTNPTHPMWIHFETFHVIEHPTYMSMYPPAQGIVLAAGHFLSHPSNEQTLTDGAWIGQLLITALMCSAMCWMLQGWFPPRWALLGAILAALRLGILSYWMNAYWCASVAAFGGALVLGAWPRLHRQRLHRQRLHRRRLRKRPSVSAGLILAVGLVILANSRPFEGLVFSIPVACAMLAWIAGRDRPPLRQSLAFVVVPISAILLLGGLATGFYYYRVTGSPFVMTYQVNRSEYATAPYFIWQHPRPEPAYHHAVMRDYYRRELAEFEWNRTVTGYAQRAAQKVENWWQFYLGPLLTVPMLALPCLFRGVFRKTIGDRKMRLPLLICGAMVAAFAVQTWTMAHYFSPATGALYILLVQGLRHLRLWRRHDGATGRAIVRAIPTLACAMILLRVIAAANAQIEPEWPRGNLDRARVERALTGLPDKQLVLVRYGDHHDLDHDWVWNQSSIDDAKVVWARDMGNSKNQELLHYFNGRQVWRINGDDSPPHLEPYSDSGSGD